MENNSTSNRPARKHSIDQEAFIYMVMPFQIITTKNGNNDTSTGNLFDEVTDHQINVNASNLMEKLNKFELPIGVSTRKQCG